MAALTAESYFGTASHWEDNFARDQDIVVQICVADAHLGIPVFFIECAERVYSRSREVKILMSTLGALQVRDRR
jgi:hypothetical protein